MRWTKVDPYHWESACKRYTVSRAMMFDKDPRGAWLYSAWKRSPTDAPEQLGKCTPQLETAVKRCRDDRIANEKAKAA